jgi:hypothetical protein
MFRVCILYSSLNALRGKQFADSLVPDLARLFELAFARHTLVVFVGVFDAILLLVILERKDSNHVIDTAGAGSAYGA